MIPRGVITMEFDGNININIDGKRESFGPGRLDVELHKKGPMINLILFSADGRCWAEIRVLNTKALDLIEELARVCSESMRED